MGEVKPWIKYAQDVVDGKIVTGRFIKLSCKNYLEYINSDKYELRNDVVERCIKFIKLFKHFKGKHSKKPFELENWQKWIISAIVGVYHRGTNKRKHSSVYLEIARKNGKSCLSAALSLYFMIADGMDGAECCAAANSREQARILFEFCEVWAKQLDPKGKDIKVQRDRILFPANNSKLIVCSSADDKLDGHNFTTATVDEYHAAKTSRVYDVIKSSMVRENSLMIVITTAGFDKTLPCYKLRSTYIEVLEGLKQDDGVFAAIYSIDEGDDWTDRNVWQKSTPNINVTVTEDYISRQVQTAINNPSEEVGVRTKTLNEWLSSSDVWISDRYINAVTENLDFKGFADCECWVGVDLSAISDMSAVTYLLKKENDDKLYFKTDIYLPEQTLIDSPNRDLYQLWHRQGLLKTTQGNVVDYDYIINDIMKHNETIVIKKISYDSWNSTMFAVTASAMCLPLEPYAQNIGNFNKPTKECERLIKKQGIVIDNNEIIRWAFKNVQIKIDHNGNEKPMKGSKDKKIDPVISMLMALGGYLQTPHFSGSISVI